MKKKQRLTLLLIALMLLSLLTGCGGSTKSVAPMEEAMEAPAAAPEMMANGALMSDTSSASGSTALPESRKWIITVNLYAETEDLDAMTEALDEKISAMNGYVEDQNLYNGSTYASRRHRSAHLTIRVPAKDVDRFTDEVSTIANVVSQEKNLEDITLRYVSTESRMKALQTEEARLLEFMEEAETMADLLEIEARLTDVRSELENVTSQLRLYDNQVDYATIYLDVEEVQKYTLVEEPSFLERITDGFSDNLKNLGEGFVDFIVWLVTSSPYLVVYGVLALVLVLLVRRVRRINAKKRAAKFPGEEKK